MKLSLEFEITIPQVPNFVMIKRWSKVIRSEMKDTEVQEEKISVGDLEDSQIEQIGAEWTKRLKARAAEIRNGKK